MTPGANRATSHPASFRDPTGRVYVLEDRILRVISGKAVNDYRFARDTGFLDRLADKGWIVRSVELDASCMEFDGPRPSDSDVLVEHPRIPFISYPYEWPFRSLQLAALLHLDIHLAALDAGLNLSDATAYNVQFVGSKPVFIDISSFVRYKEGEYWLGHRQFCEQFLNPLLLQATTGVPYQPWYRGALDGLSVAHLAQLLPWRTRANWRFIAHIFLPNHLQRSAVAGHAGPVEGTSKKQRPLSRSAFVALLRQLRTWIAGLTAAGADASTWSDYESSRTYNERQQAERLEFVRSFISISAPKVLWDFGCNAGEFSIAALDAGATTVVGFDFDHGALATAVDRAERSDASFLPLFLDAANPSPSQGWDERERQSLRARSNADALIAMAFEHHLAIGKNVPLPQLLDWLISLAPRGVVEFVGKRDPQVRRMLSLREDIFPNYSVEAFTACLADRSAIVKQHRVTDSERHLFWYETSS